MQIPNPSQNPMAFIFCKWALQFVRLEVHETEAKISKELKNETPKKGLPFQRLKLQNPKVAKSYNNSLTKWLYCHAILSHTSLTSLCYTDKGNFFYPLHPNNSIDILNTDLSTFPVVMTRRICLTIWNF